MYFFYSLLLSAGMLLGLPWWLFQMLRHGKYTAGLSERLGRVPPGFRRVDSEPQDVIWIHAVSVGEVLAISHLVEELRRRLPHHRIVISTTTDTGQTLARKKFAAENVFYFPIDFAFAIRPWLRALHPKLVILAETEFWPNFLRLAHSSGAPIVVVNARISDRSWPNYRRFRWALRRMLRHVDSFLTQSEQDAERLRSIGASPERVKVAGNLKFDMPPASSPPVVDELRASLTRAQAGPVLVCGSTVDGEEPLLLRAFENVLVSHPRAVMILAPRHPERFDAVAIFLQQIGISFTRRSQWKTESLAGRVLLVDTIGELAALYGLADIAFVGGSLVPRGGHNIIEPAQHGVPIVVGNHTENFRDIVDLFRRRDAVRMVGPAELPLTFLELLANENEGVELGKRARETASSQTGATARTADALMQLLRPEPANAQGLTAPVLQASSQSLTK